MSVKQQVWMMYPINQWVTSCSSQAVNAATCNGQPCNSDIVSIAVNTKPRALRDRRTLFQTTIVLPQSVREASTDGGTARPECANQRPSGAL